MVRVHYEAHDRQYQLRKAAGSPGWGSAADVTENTGRVAAARAAGHFPTGGKLLELGCGAGDISLWLAELGYQVSGVDLSPTAVAWAREKAEARGLSADFREGDVLTLSGYPDGSFEVVVDGCCLHCIIGEDRARVLHNARRVLRPGGVLFVMTMCGDPATVDPRQRFDPVSRNLLFGDLAIRHYGQPEAIVDEIRSAGFEVSHQEVLPPPAPNDQEMLVVTAARN